MPSFRVLIVSLSAFLAGCSGMPSIAEHDSPITQAFVVHSGAPLPFVMMGSAVQWNEDYAVTVKHVYYLPGAVYQGQGDVQFFKRKASGPLPHWGSYHPGEAVTAVGYDSFYLPRTGRGQALSAMVRLDAKEGNVFYGTHDGALIKGMSGGPVLGDNGEVVGINVAYLTAAELSTTTRADLRGKERVSVFLPYAQIKREWSRYIAQHRATVGL